MKSLFLSAALALAFQCSFAHAQTDLNLRNSFPGRRVGGATRGECSARFLAHLVPASSVFAPASSGVLGLLMGPSASPRSVLLEFRPHHEGDTASTPVKQSLPASDAAVMLFMRPPSKVPTVWESSYDCGTVSGGTATSVAPDELYIPAEAGAPPAVSLLITDGVQDDRRVQDLLTRFRQSCGGQISTQDVLVAFDLKKQLSQVWPERLPVRCF
ncbi:hypothetical protein [Synechococcus sp. 1G10]|uniref:hypothetical protein n=1 Tax=Synechococcus sp. 1G10 TaxID=2025605 RepID=UPI000B996D19|nr:hypothetical protein [Synechococcus sp. 1G10]